MDYTDAYLSPNSHLTPTYVPPKCSEQPEKYCKKFPAVKSKPPDYHYSTFVTLNSLENWVVRRLLFPNSSLQFFKKSLKISKSSLKISKSSLKISVR